MQKRLLFKIDYVCKIPWGGEQGHFWPAVYMHNVYTSNFTEFELPWLDNNRVFYNDFICKPFQKFHF